MAILSNGDLVTATTLSQIDATGAFKDSVTVGVGTNTDKTIIFDKVSGASNPRIKYDSTLGALHLQLGVASFLKITSNAGTYLLKFTENGELYISGNITTNEVVS